ncbi:MAG: hypothetical protein M0P01_08070 [Treponema sp.]|nr:hypothetical protein [Treponema sp.]
MTRSQFSSFTEFRDAFRSKVTEWSSYAGKLQPLQKEAAEKDTPDYSLETAVVYNRALDDITPQDDIQLIVIGDNPGKDEQLAENNRYLVGQSGKIAEGFFRRNQVLGIDFRKNVIILNKTPVHTAKTNHLHSLQKADKDIAQLILDSQLWMAEHTALLHQKLASHHAKNDSVIPAQTQLWLVGYAELKGNGIFLPYRDELRRAYGHKKTWERVFVYQHFSMNRFSIDLRQFRDGHENMTLSEALEQLGHMHRDEIFGK